jgi:hypothetical protein
MRKVGNLIVYEAPDSPQWKFAEVDTCVRTFTGPYDDLFAMRPTRGDPMDGTGDNMIVQDASLKKEKLNQGVLTVNLIGLNPSNPTTGSSDTTLKVLVEIDWIAVQKDLRASTFWLEIDSKIDSAGWARIEKWKNEPNPALKVFGTDPYTFKFKDANEAIVTLSAAESIAAMKIIKGGEGYNVYAPIIRKTTTFSKQPTPGNAGFIVASVPVDVDIPDGYEWLKTACRDTQNQDKSWQRSEEYTGADEWDPDLYPSEESAPGKAKASKE